MANDSFPNSLAITDFNGDGYGDIAMSKGGNTPNYDGSVYVMFGHGGPWATRNLYSNPPTGGTDGVRFDCSYAADHSYCGAVWNNKGLWVTSSSAPSTDVNGDGVGDIFIPSYLGVAATGAVNAGYVYTIFGRKDNALYPWPAVFKLNSIY